MPTAIKPRMSDEAVESKTGKTWSRWFKHLDAAGGKKMTHQEITAHLSEQHGVRPWWTQMVAVTYEQARGLRDIHQKPSGYEISVSRTIAAPVSKAFKAWTDGKTRKKWLPSNLTIRKATANKSLRISWEDGKTSVAVGFLSKSPDKSQVAAQHSKLPDARAAAKMKKFWSAALDRLKDVLE
jgi:uncharacterized protein YndB with AHSA1/START domain